jgi:cold shock CspA family protein
MSLKVTKFITDEEKQEKTFCSCIRINAEELQGDRVSYEEEGRKGKVAAKVAVI